MGALFKFLVTLVAASATAAFAHFGLLLEGGDSSRSRAEAQRTVKRSAVLPATHVVVAAVR